MTAESRRAPDESVLGTVIGAYRIVEVLNQGGMGAVYRAEHTLLGKRAAIKLLLPDLSQDEEMVHRFFNEAKAASAIQHPGIVEIFDFGYHHDGRAYLVMELLDGESLGDRLHARGRVPELEAAILTCAIADALAAAHAKGIVHRDLKPDNIYLVPDADLPTGEKLSSNSKLSGSGGDRDRHPRRGRSIEREPGSERFTGSERIKVLDFGIAKLADFGGGAGGSRTRTGALLGTPAYMAPEQARGAGEVDARADLYALGCMLYEMLVGAPPFVAEGAGELIALQLFGDVEPPRARVPALSAPIEAIALRLLEKEPDARFQTAAELVDALARLMPALSGELAAVVRPSQPRKTVASVHGRATAPAVLPSLPPGASHSQVAAVVRPLLIASAPRRTGRWIALAGVIAIGAAVGMFALVRGLTGAKPAEPARGSATAAVVIVDAAGPIDAAAAIALTLAVDPPHATLALDGRPIASSPVIAIPRDGVDHLITAAAPGFVSRTLIVRGDRDQTASLALSRGDERAPTRTRDHGRGRGTKPGPSTHPDGATPTRPLTTSPNGSPIEPSI